jgi:sterol desaturase/sphingolipid hydroxylase (fatty acid hydroxylase superfamily)
VKKNNSESIRLFKSDFMESLSHVHPITPLVFWSPIIIWFLKEGFYTDHLNFSEFVITALLSLLVWTFTEYFLHRFVFHFKASSKLGRYIIFLFHGIHHDDPNDKTRLVMPPVPAVMIVSALYFFFKLLVPPSYLNTFMGWFLIGYLIYDYIHYATHHFSMTSRMGRYLRKWHLQHHHTKEPVQYGVSNPLWDYVFGTLPKKRTTLNN